MPSFPKCERHGERMCPICSPYGATLATLKSLRRRLRREHEALGRDLEFLSDEIRKARAAGKLVAKHKKLLR